MRLYREGSPLLRSLREDQKVEVRKRARSWAWNVGVEL